MRTGTLTQMLVVTVAMLVAGTAGADIIPVNADFDSGGFAGINTGNLKSNSAAGNGWYNSAADWIIGDIDSDGDNEAYWLSDGTNNGSDVGIAQVIVNNNVDTGDFTLQFDWQSTAENVNIYYSLSGKTPGNKNIVHVGSTNTTHGTELLSNGVSDGSLTVGDDFAAGSGTVSVDFTIPDGGFEFYGLRFIFTGATADAGEYFAIDNVSIGVVPEPATLALLGMGSLAMLRRRRG